MITNKKLNIYYVITSFNKMWNLFTCLPITDDKISKKDVNILINYLRDNEYKIEDKNTKLLLKSYIKLITLFFVNKKEFMNIYNKTQSLLICNVFDINIAKLKTMGLLEIIEYVIINIMNKISNPADNTFMMKFSLI